MNLLSQNTWTNHHRPRLSPVAGNGQTVASSPCRMVPAMSDALTVSIPSTPRPLSASISVILSRVTAIPPSVTLSYTRFNVASASGRGPL